MLSIRDNVYVSLAVGFIKCRKSLTTNYSPSHKRTLWTYEHTTRRYSSDSQWRRCNWYSSTTRRARYCVGNGRFTYWWFWYLLAGTPYDGGLFRVRLVLSKDFPTSPPKAYFITKIFHPNVSRNGEICVNTLKKDWKPDLGLKHVLLVSYSFLDCVIITHVNIQLQTIKCLLIVPNAESALNEGMS